MSFLVLLVEKSTAIPGLPNRWFHHLPGKPIYSPKSRVGQRQVTPLSAGGFRCEEQVLRWEVRRQKVLEERMQGQGRGLEFLVVCFFWAWWCLGGVLGWVAFFSGGGGGLVVFRGGFGVGVFVFLGGCLGAALVLFHCSQGFCCCMRIYCFTQLAGTGLGQQQKERGV